MRYTKPLEDELIDDIHQEMWRSYRRCQWLAQWMLQRGGILGCRNTSTISII